MGVADNKTYKNQYHFSDNYFKIDQDEVPSLKGEPKINSTIKENPYMSNVEIEGREMVLQPDLSALFRAVGKRHSKGGMDVMLKPDSFIFSDDKTLAVDKGKQEAFEFKKGGSTKAAANTPAAVLKRNVDAEHYNTLVNNLDSVRKDDLAKKSSMKMLEKYIATLGNIAYLQEEQKGFPQGLPSFSMGTAPVVDPEVKDATLENKQYGKFGGAVMAEGGAFGKCPCGKDDKGNCLPCTPQQIATLSQQAKTARKSDVTGMKKIGSLDQYTDLYHTGSDPSGGKKGSAEFNKAFGDARRAGLKTFTFNGKLYNTNLSTPGSDKLLKVRNFPMAKIPDTGTDQLKVPYKLPQFNTDVVQEPADPTPTEITGEGQKPLDPNWEYTPEQKVSQLYKWLNFANVKRYMPYRTHVRAEYVDPALLNEQQAVTNARTNMNTQLSATRSLNPILAGAQAQQISGQYLDKLPEVTLAVQNQNTGIKNQFRQYNNQVRMRNLEGNAVADQTYYQQAVEGRKNFDNMRTFAANDAMNLRDAHTAQNMDFAYRMMTVNNPAYLFDWKSGRFVPNPNRSIHQTGASPQDSWERMIEYAKSMRDSGLDPIVQSALLRGRYFQNAAPYFKQSATPPPFKKGGSYKNPYSY